MNISAEKLPNFTKQTVHYVKSKLAEVCIFAVTLCSSSFWVFFKKKSGGEWNYWLHKEHNTCFVMKEAMIYTLFRRIWSNTGYYWSLCRVFLVGLVLSSDMCLVACCLQNVLKMCCHIFLIIFSYISGVVFSIFNAKLFVIWLVSYNFHLLWCDPINIELENSLKSVQSCTVYYSWIKWQLRLSHETTH